MAYRHRRVGKQGDAAGRAAVEGAIMEVTIIGAGNMGRGIAVRALSGHHAVRLIDHRPQDAQQLAAELRAQNAGADIKAADLDAIAGADIVVLAVKYPFTVQLGEQNADALIGKVVVDIANPADFSTFDPATGPGTSAAEELAASVPGARVVKAFNTTFAGTLAIGKVAGEPLDVFIAGDDLSAKKAVAELAASSGLHPVDVGPLRRARALEAFQILHMSLQQDMPNPWASAVKILG
jgi:predicted dinucleotide-binding enzyme